MELSIQQVAKGLGLPVSTVERWIRQGRIPVHQGRSPTHFHLSDIERWARQHNLPFALPGKPAPTDTATLESLETALQRGGIYYQVPGDTTESVLAATVSQAAFLTEPQRQDLLFKLVEREQMASTGIGKGVAVPHPRHPLADGPEKTTILAAFLQTAIDYGAIDDLPVNVLFILLCPDVKNHLNMLSRLAYCLRNDAFIEFLNTAPPEDALCAQIARMESTMESPHP